MAAVKAESMVAAFDLDKDGGLNVEEFGGMLTLGHVWLVVPQV